MAYFRPPPVSRYPSDAPSPPVQAPAQNADCSVIQRMRADCACSDAGGCSSPVSTLLPVLGKCGRMRIMDEQRGRYYELSAPERDRRIAFLRGRGWTYKKIGRAVGMSESGVRRAGDRIRDGGFGQGMTRD